MFLFEPDENEMQFECDTPVFITIDTRFSCLFISCLALSEKKHRRMEDYTHGEAAACLGAPMRLETPSA